MNIKLLITAAAALLAPLSVSSCSNCTEIPFQNAVAHKNAVRGTVVSVAPAKVQLNNEEAKFVHDTIGFLGEIATTVMRNNRNTSASDVYLKDDIQNLAHGAVKFIRKPGQIVTVKTTRGHQVTVQQPIYCHCGPLMPGQKVYIYGNFYGRKVALPRH